MNQTLQNKEWRTPTNNNCMSSRWWQCNNKCRCKRFDRLPLWNQCIIARLSLWIGFIWVELSLGTCTSNSLSISLNIFNKFWGESCCRQRTTYVWTRCNISSKNSELVDIYSMVYACLLQYIISELLCANHNWFSSLLLYIMANKSANPTYS